MRFLPLDPMHQSINPKPMLTNRDFWLLALLTAGALILRLIGLNEGLWTDEIFTLLGNVRKPIQKIFLAHGGRNNHAMYSVLAHLSSSFFGESAWSIRLPAALLGTATIPAAYYLGLQIATRREALLTAVFLLANYHHVWYSQSARAYSGALFAAVLLSIIFIRLLHTQKPPWTVVAAYSAVAVLGIWLHLTLALLVLAHGIVWLGISIRDRRGGMQAVNWRAALAMAAGAMLSLAPYAGIIAGLIGSYVSAVVRNNGVMSIVVAGTNIENWWSNEVVQGLFLAVPGGAFFIPVLILALLSIIGAGFWSYARQGWLSWGILALPPAVVVIVFLALSEMIYPRFLLFCMVFLLLTGVRGGYLLANWLMPSLTMKQISTIGLIIALASALMVPRAYQPKQDFFDARDYLQTHVEESDALVCYRRFLKFVFDKYLGLNCTTANNLDELLTIEASHTRTWYVYTLPLFFRHGKIRKRLKNEYTIAKVASSTVNKGEIVILLRENREASR